MTITEIRAQMKATCNEIDRLQDLPEAGEQLKSLRLLRNQLQIDLAQAITTRLERVFVAQRKIDAQKKTPSTDTASSKVSYKKT